MRRQGEIGDVLTVRDGDVSMEILPAVGGRVHSLTVCGRQLLRRPVDQRSHLAEPLFWGSYPLVPWSNRIPGGRLRFHGAVHTVPETYPGHAIHGQAFLPPWQVDDVDCLHFEGGGDAFPWTYRSTQRFSVDDGVIVWDIDVRNTSPMPMPAGLGFHPWFSVTPESTITIPAASVYPSHEQVPVGDPVPVAPGTDLRRATPIPFGLDETWTDLGGDPVRLVLPHQGLEVELLASGAATHLVFAAMAHLEAVAIEAVTHVTDGHARREEGRRGAIGVLDPGETLRLRYEWRITEL